MQQCSAENGEFLQSRGTGPACFDVSKSHIFLAISQHLQFPISRCPSFPIHPLSSMSSQPSPPPPPVPASPPNSGGVRRHHTISASSRGTRGAVRDSISEEVQDQGPWNDDDVVDQDWVGGVGAVGEKTSLHRQSSLPTRYHRG